MQYEGEIMIPSIVMLASHRTIKRGNKRALGKEKLYRYITATPPEFSTSYTLHRMQGTCRYQETDKTSFLPMTSYSDIFIGGSRLSTRMRRSKSLSSNFLMKGWFCKNIYDSSEQDGRKMLLQLSSLQKLLNRRQCWPRVLKQTSAPQDPFVCCKAM